LIGYPTQHSAAQHLADSESSYDGPVRWAGHASIWSLDRSTWNGRGAPATDRRRAPRACGCRIHPRNLSSRYSDIVFPVFFAPKLKHSFLS
jgi:hypothetical protein